MGRLPNVKSAYVTFQNFTPHLQKICTDISAVSVTLCNFVFQVSIFFGNMVSVLGLESMGLAELTRTHWTPFFHDGQPDLDKSSLKKLAQMQWATFI